ncbi:NADPH-dependent FMN reductase [Ancylobacter defluvii]|uniref:FMN reductase n=1 Tax=Ancylobacter defluvii TaxID=1282440 RepID=A0A9W6JVA7_9HYPH|nr:NAD(P)H-dependent oxidoreductase [Ancylobacter defluvii]MBS7590354.1 NAD(P)H-dependent oxidoreductase [Ancylobacter defluvii]GLK83271.1 FMN reductase [Ancylobacter defluvii]
MRPPKILTFAGSIRTGSYSANLAAVAAKELALLGAEPVLISLQDYPLPIYDADLEAEEGVPQAAEQLRDQLALADGVFIATPEYNASVSPLLKNAIDWASRAKGAPGGGGHDPFKGPVFAIGSTSPGALGGYRAAMMLRQVLALGLSALVLAEQAMVPAAHQAFTDAGDFKDDRQLERLRGTLRTLIDQSALRAGLRA